ncbi:NUMOD4 domain-containing protein [Lactiplantibacillus plantarum]|uniref:NUMOD4 domain-containing protein n=1 Tax=Lactiplantibacillus plantarum TaxID=1590 RepID=UPI001F4D2950|nr:NUMOD4 domain-containing protein [Lactiplantibacillus plantarum]MCH8625824.1 NUMOD4 motif-containing HNH endonuclease [Lactiplantibacillus plantarum]
MTTVWKDIPGYEGIYQASIYGYVRSVNRIVYKGRNHTPSQVKGKIITPWLDHSGYLKVDLYRYGKRRCEKVHQMIAKTFIPNPQCKETINHKDENPLNNTVLNLEWMTNKENVNYGTRVQRVKEKYGYHIIRIAPNGMIDDFFTLHEAEKRTGIPRQSIAYAIKHKTKLKGYIWEFFGR